jgi:hypothetical protein
MMDHEPTYTGRPIEPISAVFDPAATHGIDYGHDHAYSYIYHSRDTIRLRATQEIFRRYLGILREPIFRRIYRIGR